MDLQALVESDMEGAMEGVKISNNDKNVSKTNESVPHAILRSLIASFQLPTRNSIRAFVRPSVRRSVGPW